MSELAKDKDGHRIQATRAEKLQARLTVTASNVQSAAVEGGTGIVIIGATCDCLIAQGEDPDAENAPTGFIFAGAMVYKRVHPGNDKFAFVQAGATGGTAYIEEDTSQ